MLVETKNKNHYFHVIGGNETDIEYWKKKCQNTNLIFHGFIEPCLVPSYLCSFDILIAPYQDEVLISNGIDTSEWMSPLKLFEYMSVRKPILTSNIKVLKEIFVHKVNSYLCDPSDQKEWEEGLKYLINNSKHSKKIAKTSHENFIDNYSWDARAKLFLVLIDEQFKCNSF